MVRTLSSNPDDPSLPHSEAAASDQAEAMRQAVDVVALTATEEARATPEVTSLDKTVAAAELLVVEVVHLHPQLLEWFEYLRSGVRSKQGCGDCDGGNIQLTARLRPDSKLWLND